MEEQGRFHWVDRRDDDVNVIEGLVEGRRNELNPTHDRGMIHEDAVDVDARRRARARGGRTGLG